jgi:tetratricopeptide (TPR) repeat protein
MRKYILISVLFLSVNAFSNIAILKANYKKAIDYYNIKNYTKAASYFLSVIRSSSSRKKPKIKAVSLLMLGKCYNKTGMYNAAEYYLYQIFRNTPMNKYYKEGLLEIAKTFIFSRRYKKAIEVYNYIDTKFHDYKYLSEAMYLKGEVYLLLRNKPKAVLSYKYIVENYPNTKRYSYAKKRLKELISGEQTSAETIGSSGNQSPQAASGLSTQGSTTASGSAATGSTNIPDRTQIDVPTEEFYNQARELEAAKLKLSELERLLSEAKKELNASKTSLENAKEEIERLKKTNTENINRHREEIRRLQGGNSQTTVPATGTSASSSANTGSTAASANNRASSSNNTGSSASNTGRTGATSRPTPVEPRREERVPDIRFPSFRSYYPPNEGFARRLRYDFLRGISNLSEEDLKKLEARLRLLERRESELARIRKELTAFHRLLIAKDRLLFLKQKALTLLKKQIKQKEDAVLKLMKLKKEMERRLGLLNTGNSRNN